MLIEGFNAQTGEKSFDNFPFQHECKSVNDKPTFYKNPDKPSCIDFILTFYFAHYVFTKATVYLLECQTVINKCCQFLKQPFQNQNQRELFIETLIFDEEDFNQVHCGKLSTELINNYSSIENISIDVVDRHAPLKKKVQEETMHLM